MRRTVSLTTVLVLTGILLTAGTALGQGVTNYNGPVPSTEDPQSPSGWPTDGFFFQGGLKQVMQAINQNNAYGPGNNAYITLQADLVGAAAGVNDNAFQAVNGGKWMTIGTDGQARIIGTYPTAVQAQPIQAYHPYISFFTVQAGGRLDFNGEITLQDASRRNSGSGGALQIFGEARLYGELSFLRNESNSNGGAIGIGEGASLNPQRGSGNLIFDANHASNDGGAIFSDLGGSAYFDGTMLFTNNRAQSVGTGVGSLLAGGGDGGAISMLDSDFTFWNTAEFTNNYAWTNGGAVAIKQGSSTSFLDVAVFNGNIADIGDGGAIYAVDSGLSFATDAYFGYNPNDPANSAGNQADGDGGAIYITNATRTLSFGGIAVFERNNSSPGGNGGGVYADTTDITFSSNVRFGERGNLASGNSTDGDGGALWMNGGTLAMNRMGSPAYYDNEFYNNSAGNHGGALHTSGVTVNVRGNSIYEDNYAGRGGAIFTTAGSEYRFQGTTEFYDNYNTGSGTQFGEGGAIKAVNSTLTFVGETIFQGNYSRMYTHATQGYLSEVGGGAIHAGSNSNFTFEKDSFFYSNYGNFGGAIYSTDASNFVFGSTTNPATADFTANNAFYGGAIYSTGNSQFSFNSGLEGSRYTQFISNGDSSVTPGNTGMLSRQGGAISADGGSVFTFIGQTDFIGNKTESDWGTGGSTPLVQMYSGGGAIYANGATFSFESGTRRSTTFQDNSSYTAGGGMFIMGDSTFTFDGKLAFLGNKAAQGNGSITSGYTGENYGGGAFYIHDSSMTVNTPNETVLFNDNEAGVAGLGVNGDGGGFLATGTAAHGGSTVTFNDLSRVRFADNQATRDGGGFKADYGSTVTFHGTAAPVTGINLPADEIPGFYDNIAGRDGGAGHIDQESTVVFEDAAWFESNEAGRHGGALYVVRGGTLTFNNTADFHANVAGNGGGALYVDGDAGVNTSATFTNGATFEDNQTTAGHGGAILALNGAQVGIAGNSVFHDNTAPAGLGGAIYIEGMGSTDPATVTLHPDTSGQTVEFKGNRDSTGANAVHLERNARLHLTPVAGTTILFYDPISSSATGPNNNVIDMDGGTGTVKLWDVSNYYGDTNINSGTFTLAAAAEPGYAAGKFGSTTSGTFSLGTGGTIEMEEATALKARQIKLDGGTVKVSGNAEIEAGVGGIVLTENGGAFSVANGIEFNVKTPIGDIDTDGDPNTVGNLTKDGAGTLVFSAVQEYHGETIIKDGTLQLRNADDILINTSIVRLQGNSIMDLQDTNQRFGSLQGDATTEIRFGDNANNTLTVNVASGSLMDKMDYAGKITGTGTFVKEGDGTLYLSGSNTYASGTADPSTRIEGGTLGIRNVLALGTGAVLIDSDGVLELNIGAGAPGRFTNNVSGSGNVLKTGSGSIGIAGTIDLTSNAPNTANMIITAGTLDVVSGGQVNVENVLLNGGTLNVELDGHVRAANNVQIADGTTLSLTVDASRTGRQVPAIVADNKIVIGNNTTFNLNVLNFSMLDEGRELVLLHGGHGIVDAATPGLSGSGAFTSTTINGFGYNVGEFNEDVYVVLGTPNTQHNDDDCAMPATPGANDYSLAYGLAWFANNDFAHGTFNTAAGNFTIQDDVNLSDQKANISSSGQVLWDGKTLKKRGANALILQGANTYSGNTFIEQGTIEIQNIGALGTATDTNKQVYNEGTLRFNLTDNTVGFQNFSQSVSGGGRVEKTGTGRLILGGTQTYTGGTLVSGGELTLATNVSRSGFSVTGSGSILSGSGTIASLNAANGGTVSPGRNDGAVADRFGTLDVTGAAVFGPGSTYDLQIAANGKSDRISAGSANLTDGAIKVTPIIDASTGEFTANQYVYDRILTGELNGTKFGSRDFSLLDTLGYTAELYYTNDNTVSLVLVNGQYRFGNITGGSWNVRSLGNTLDGIVENDESRQIYRGIFQGIRGLDTDGARQAVKDLAPDVIANGMMIGQWDVARPTLNRLNLDQGNITQMPRNGMIRNDFWIDPFYQSFNMLGDENGRAYGISRTGLLLGVDRQFTPTIKAGLVFGYSNPLLQEERDRVKGHDFQIGFYYGQNLINGLEFRGYLGYGMQSYESKRYISNPVLSAAGAMLQGDYQGDSVIATAEITRPFIGKLAIFRPIVGLDIMTTTQGGHAEKGDPRLAGDFERVHFGRALARVGGRFDLAQTDYTSLWFQMFYSVKFAGEDAPETKFRFVAAPDLPATAIRGSDPGGGYFSLGFGNHWNLNKRKTRQFMIHYDLLVSERECVNTGSLGFKQKF